MVGIKIRTNGFVSPYQLTEEKYTYIALQKSISCDCIDIVHAAKLPEPYCLVVDDEGLLKDKPVVNIIASYLYGVLDHGQPLCGDCIVMKDKYTEDGVETVGLDEEDAVKVHGILKKAFAEGEIDKSLQRIKRMIEK